jgi:hypothetical protein
MSDSESTECWEGILEVGEIPSSKPSTCFHFKFEFDRIIVEQTKLRGHWQCEDDQGEAKLLCFALLCFSGRQKR